MMKGQSQENTCTHADTHTRTYSRTHEGTIYIYIERDTHTYTHTHTHTHTHTLLQHTVIQTYKQMYAESKTER